MESSTWIKRSGQWDNIQSKSFKVVTKLYDLFNNLILLLMLSPANELVRRADARVIRQW
jgi:hypothetical protein